MRKFKFVGDPKEYDWEIKPIKNELYDSFRVKSSYGEGYAPNVFESMSDLYPDDWQEVTDQPTTECKGLDNIYIQKQSNRIPNQDMPSTTITKLEYISTMLLQGMISGNAYPDVDYSIEKAKELIKQLENEKV